MLVEDESSNTDSPANDFWNFKVGFYSLYICFRFLLNIALVFFNAFAFYVPLLCFILLSSRVCVLYEAL